MPRQRRAYRRCTREAALNAEVEAVDAAEVVEGVVDDGRVVDPDTEAEADPDADLEARLANFEGLTEGRRLTRMLNQTTQTQSYYHLHYHFDSQTPSTTPRQTS